jgi:hypothetical protein
MGQGFEDGAPEHGARFRLRLLEATEDRARYEVEVIGPRGAARCEAALAPSRVEAGSFDGDVEPWAAETALSFLKVLAKGFDPEEGWPRELRRWRAPRG